jgi:hypothetical protein
MRRAASPEIEAGEVRTADGPIEDPSVATEYGRRRSDQVAGFLRDRFTPVTSGASTSGVYGDPRISTADPYDLSSPFGVPAIETSAGN